MSVPRGRPERHISCRQKPAHQPVIIINKLQFLTTILGPSVHTLLLLLLLHKGFLVAGVPQQVHVPLEEYQLIEDGVGQGGPLGWDNVYNILPTVAELGSGV